MILPFILTTAMAAPQCLDTSESFSLPNPSNAYLKMEISPDGQYGLNSGYGSSKFHILDTNEKTIKEYPKPLNSSVVRNGYNAVIIDFSGATISSFDDYVDFIKNTGFQVLDLKTGKREIKKGVVPYKGGFAEIQKATNTTMTIKTSKGKVLEIPFAAAFSPSSLGNEDSPDVSSSESQLSFSPNAGESFRIDVPGFSPNTHAGSFTPDNKYYVLKLFNTNSSDPRPVIALDMKTKEVKTIKLPKDTSYEDITKLNYNPKTETFLAHNINSSNVLGINLAKGEVESVAKMFANSGYISGLHFNSKGQICGMSTSYDSGSPGYGSLGATSKICGEAGSDIKGPGVPISDQPNMLPLTEEIFQGNNFSNGSSTLDILLSSNYCPKNEVTVSCDCDVEKPTDGTSNLENIKSVVIATACSAPYEEKSWDKLTTDSSILNETQAVIWLKRFSKPGAFTNQRLDTLIGILGSNIPKAYPGLTKSAIRSIMVTRPSLFFALAKRFPKLMEIKAAPDNSCLTAKEKTELETGLYTTLQAEFKKTPSNYEKLKKLAIFGKDSLTDLQRQSLSELAADRMVEVGGTGATAGVFSSKIYYFSEYNFQRHFGLPSKDMTDFTVVRNNNQLRVLQLGRDAFPGAKESPSGVFVKELGSIPTDSIKSDSRTEKYKWKYASKEYLGELSIDKIIFDESHMALNKSPDYKDMWKDKEFRGVVVAGSNLGSITQSVMNEYLEYYMENGFTFEPTQENSDMLNYMKEKVQGKGQMDYFIKEAHSGGDEKTMFDIAKTGKIMVGAKQVGDRKEIVELIFPAKVGGENVSLHNEDFGAWAREREKNGGSELLYLNTSCWSATKAVYEIPAAATKKLVNIPTTSMVTTFVNHGGNIMRNLVEGVRTEKSYEGIRELLANNPEFKAGTGNKVIFPDENDYRTRIVDQLKTPISLNSKVLVKNSAGQYENYSIGQQ